MPKCDNECTDKDKIYKCGDRSEDGYFCTRSPGHKGVHVACDVGNHEMDVWNGECDHLRGFAEDDNGWPYIVRSSDNIKESLRVSFNYCSNCGEKNQ